MKKDSLKRFYKNIIHLFRYSIKEMYHNQLESRAALPGLVEKIKRETKNDWEMIRTFHIKDGFETIQELIDTQKSLIRFGDGEIMLMRTTGGGGLPSKNMILGLHRVCVKSFFQMMRDC